MPGLSVWYQIAQRITFMMSNIYINSHQNSLSAVEALSLKLVSAIFYLNFVFHYMIALKKLWKMFFILSKKLFTFSRYSIFFISIFYSFSPVSYCFRGWSKINLIKVYNVFIWYLEKEKRYDIETMSTDRVLNKEHFYGKAMQKMCNKS